VPTCRQATTGPERLASRTPKNKGPGGRHRVSATSAANLTSNMYVIPSVAKGVRSVKDIRAISAPPSAAFKLVAHSAYRFVLRDYLD